MKRWDRLSDEERDRFKYHPAYWHPKTSTGRRARCKNCRDLFFDGYYFLHGPRIDLCRPCFAVMTTMHVLAS